MSIRYSIAMIWVHGNADVHTTDQVFRAKVVATEILGSVAERHRGATSVSRNVVMRSHS